MTAAEVAFRLNRDERRTLERIVDTDFKGLYVEIKNRANEWLTVTLKEIDAKYAKAEYGLTEMSRLTRALREKFQQQFETHLEKLKQKGYVLSSGSGKELLVPTSFRILGRDEEVNSARLQYQRALDRALRNLEKQRLTALRTVLLTGIISTEANAILDNLPTAEDILAAALEEEKPAIEAAK